MFGFYFSEEVENKSQRWFLVYLWEVAMMIFTFYIIHEVTFTMKDAFRQFLACLIMIPLLVPYAILIEKKAKEDPQWVSVETTDEGFTPSYWLKVWKWI